MGKHIKTYGEIQYYLYDGDKKENKVSKDSFMNSKDVSVKHNSPKPEQSSTKSLTGKVIENFEMFCNEYNGPNLSLDYNHDYNFKSMQGKQFDGGDGPSGTNEPEKFKRKVKDTKKIDRGHDDNETENRETKRKKFSKEFRNAKINKNQQTTDDLVATFNLYDPKQNQKL